MAAVQIILFFLLVIGLAYFQVPVLVWTLSILAGLLVLTTQGLLSETFFILFWGCFLSAALFANSGWLRRNLFTRPVRKLLQKRLPPLSETEREALEAGDIWWEKDLFCGRPDWQTFLAQPLTVMTSAEKHFIDHQVETLCGMLNDWEIVAHQKDLPKAVWDYLKKEGFFGLVIPKKYGGHGFSALTHSTIIMKIATRSISAAVNTMVPNSLGPGELILHYGTEEQKEYYLPRLAQGKEIPCFALTEPEAGSDAGSITDPGIVCYGEHEGKKTLGIRLSWDKRYITLAPIATVLGIAFHLYDPEGLLKKEKDIGITLALIPTSLSGVEIGTRHYPGYLAFMNGPTRGENVFIPMSYIIGGIEKAGQGWKMLMECLSIGRSISLPALSTACGNVGYRFTGAYARLRKQFNLSIGYFEGVEEALGYIAGMMYTLEACRRLTASAIDQHMKPSTASAIAKYHMTEMSRKIMSHAMDIQAGHGIQVGPRNFIANGYLGIPISITVEGANILTRNLIIFGQGAIRCHPFLLREMELLNSSSGKDNLKAFDQLLLSHIGFFTSQFVRNVCHGLTGGILIRTPVHDATKKYYRQLSRMSVALSWLSDWAMLLLGGDLKRKERISARLGDILSELYLGSAILKYYHDEGRLNSDLDYVQWSSQMCLYRIQIACDELCDNFPNRWLGKFIHFIIFPWGPSYLKPRDSLCHRIVNAMLTPSDLRKRLTQFCYVGKDSHESTYRMEEALQKIDRIDPIWKKFHGAMRRGTIDAMGDFESRLQSALKKNVLSQEEVVALRDFDALLKEVIKVDEFSFDLSKVY